MTFKTFILAAFLLPPLAATQAANTVSTQAANTVPMQAANALTVKPVTVPDEKAVFATVESANVVAARARIGGTVAELSVRAGDAVTQGQIIAVVGDKKIALQIDALNAQIEGYAATAAQAKSERARLEKLVHEGIASRAAMEQARKNYSVAESAETAAKAQRDVLRRQIADGEVRAPVAGRILNVPVTADTVVMPGETIATVAEQHYILRLEVPERHAGSIHVGDPVRIDNSTLKNQSDKPVAKDKIVPDGKIVLVYPQIKDGRVIADAAAPDLGNYFVGERVRVWISVGTRTTIVIPPGDVYTRFGVYYVRLQMPDGKTEAVPVQRGQLLFAGREILSGLHGGDIVVQP